MCIPKGSKRDDQLEVQNQVLPSDQQKVTLPCEQAKKVTPKLIALEVTGASPLGGDRYWVLRDDRAKVRVKAVTEPPNTPVTWSGGTATSSPVVQEVAVSVVADVPVKATLDCEKSVTIEIYDLISVSCPLPLKLGKHKAYVSDKTTRLTAVTSPDAKKVWDLLTWSEGAAGPTNNLRDVDLKPVGDRTVTVSLGSKKLPVDLHICQWPRLKIKEITFECHAVLNDGVAEIGVAFDKKWKKGRPAPAVNQKAADSQSPICFTAQKKVKLSAVFDVTVKATDDETVSVKGDLGFGEIKADVAVGSGADTANMALTESTKALSDLVNCDDAWAIPWTHVLEDNATWVDADSSSHLLYVLFKDPLKEIYFTLLDISCRAAKGKNVEAEVAHQSFEPYKTHTGDGGGFPRKGDGLKMSYYKTGYNTAADDTTWTTKGMLGSPEATGRCGGWVEFLLHMWALHGITTATKRWYIRATAPSEHNNKLRFQVKSLTFKAATLGGPYTHDGQNDVTKNNGLPGQGKTNPQFDFSDHVVAKYNGKIYDPSYGVGADTDKAYLAGALDGIGYEAFYTFVMGDGTDQFIARLVRPYTNGFAIYTISATVTFDAIAAAHGLTKQAIFDHAANGPLKTLRKTVDKVVNGDRIVITSNLQPGGQWVLGHDI
jgi:hypothetical protein